MRTILIHPLLMLALFQWTGCAQEAGKHPPNASEPIVSTAPSTRPHMTEGDESLLTPEVVADLRKQFAEDSQRLRVAVLGQAKEHGLELVPGTYSTNAKYEARVTVTYKGSVIFEDVVTVKEGHWSTIETTDVKKYSVLISQTNKKDTRFVSFMIEYVYDNHGRFMLPMGFYNKYSPSKGPYESSGGDTNYKYKVIFRRLP